MRIVKLLQVITLFAAGICQVAMAGGMTISEVRQELESMFVTDQAQRFKVREIREKYGQNSLEHRALWDEQHKTDDANIKRLTEIVQTRGWPEQSVFKGKAAAAAFMVLQHAPLEDQKRLFPVMRSAVEQGEARPQDLALLEDRILVREGKLQKYGSQISQDRVTGKASFHPIEDESNVDIRRAAVGLGPLSDYAQRFGFIHSLPSN